MPEVWDTFEETEDLNATDWLVLVILGLVFFPLMLLAGWVERRRAKRGEST